ncbi:MAG: hypothetical protein AABX70_02815 [Nanoarchaeota archaeon]
MGSLDNSIGGSEKVNTGGQMIAIRGACSEQVTPDGSSYCTGGCDYGTCRKTHTGSGCVCAGG